MGVALGWPGHNLKNSKYGNFRDLPPSENPKAPFPSHCYVEDTDDILDPHGVYGWSKEGRG